MGTHCLSIKNGFRRIASFSGGIHLELERKCTTNRKLLLLKFCAI